jgi:predicted alpha/beta-hydrolase family hydrolase
VAVETFEFDVADPPKAGGAPRSGIADVGTHGQTTARVYRAKEPLEATLVLAHGAGAPQTHPFMIDMATRIAARGIDVVTFDFLYLTRGRKLPDKNEILEATWHAAIASTRARGGLPTERLFIGGKSMGGRIASQVAATGTVRATGLVFLGYPLHPPKRRELRRDEHLPRVTAPMLFVQGTRDELGTAKELKALAKKLPRATVHVVEGGDHSLALLRRAGAAAQEEALDGAAEAIFAFVQKEMTRERKKR